MFGLAYLQSSFLASSDKERNALKCRWRQQDNQTKHNSL